MTTPTVSEPPADFEATATRGQQIYLETISPCLSAEDRNKFVAIDVRTGCYAIDADDYTATELLLARCPQAQMWLERVGHATAYRMGGRGLERSA